MRGRKKREREEPDLKRREEVKVAIVMEVCCKSKNGSWLRGKKSQELKESTTPRGGRRSIQEGTVRIVVPATEDGRDEISKARKALVLGTLGEKFGQCCWKNGTSGWE